MKVAGAKIAFGMNRSTGRPLPAEMIEILSRNYGEPPKVRYDPDGLLLRAWENVTRIKQWVDLKKVRSALELGCWDGMVSAQLRDQVDQCWALDLSRKGFDPRAGDRGVCRVQGDAGHLPFDPASFDLVFSFAAFEHFSDPARVLGEVARILRSGGFFYLEFGPIAMAPYGLHAYRSIPAPYLQILFDVEDVRRYARTKGLNDQWPYINGMSLSDYRRMFEAAKRDFKTIALEERGTGGVGAELIIRYPDVFRCVSDRIEDFLVSGMTVCLQRK